MKAFNILILFIVLSFGFSISAQTVYTTKTGEKYLKSNCRYLKYSKKEIKLERAKSLGYLPCKICKPTKINTERKSSDTSLTSKESNKPTPLRKTVASQCTGKIKSGKRCKRKTKNSNGRCYQH